MAFITALKLIFVIAPILILSNAESEHSLAFLESQIRLLMDKSLEQDSVIEDLKHLIHDQDSAIEVLKHLINDQDSTIEVHKHLINSQDLAIEDLNHVVNSQNGRIASLEGEIASLTLFPKSFQTNNETVEERLRHLEEVSKVKILRSCEELHNHGVSESGWYFIDPDGEETGLPPIRVMCDFKYQVTEIPHDSDDTFIIIAHCEDQHCFNKDLIYSAPMQQIQSLIQLSSTCYQDINYQCYQAPLLYKEVNLGTWDDKIGEPQVYFDGSNFGEHRCNCFNYGNCSGENLYNTTCNCDNINVPEWMEDSGRVTNATALPITSFTYGPLMYETQQARVKIGRLRCSGKAEIKNPPTTCNDLKRMGEMRPGIYSLNEEDGYPRLAFCNMDKPGYIGNLETQSHLFKFTTGPGMVVFSVRHDGQNDIHQGSTITYDREMINIGSGMDMETGVFTAPVAGVYQFKFSGLTEISTGVVEIFVYVNERVHVSIYDTNASGYNPLSRAWIVQLEKGDTIKLVKHNVGGLHSNNGGHALEFIGSLV